MSRLILCSITICTTQYARTRHIYIYICTHYSCVMALFIMLNIMIIIIIIIIWRYTYAYCQCRQRQNSLSSLGLIVPTPSNVIILITALLLRNMLIPTAVQSFGPNHCQLYMYRYSARLPWRKHVKTIWSLYSFLLTFQKQF